VRLLVDTHCWLWMQTDPERFTPTVKSTLLAADTVVLLSAASSWEIAIKYALGRLPLPLPPTEYVPSRMQRSGTMPLPIEHYHCLHVSTLPLHHRDPFDRLLIAQAQLENLPLLTADRQLQSYDAEIILAN